MAEAHAAVAFSFNVTPDGVHVNLNHEALWAVWHSGVLSWQRRVTLWKNDFHNGIYPASPASWLFALTIVLALKLAGVDPSYGIIALFQHYTPFLSSASPTINLYGSCILYATLLWLVIINIIKYFLRFLLSYQGWMYELRGPKSTKTKIWFSLMKIFGSRKPLLNSYAACMPKLPVPSVEQTMGHYLTSVRPLLDDEKYARMEKLAAEFHSGIGKKLQRYLLLKSWWATNYVTDWWEEYVYLRGRAPIMINSNFYGVDALLIHATHVQSARAGNLINAILQYRQEVVHEELSPILLNGTVPLCSAQYERQFNTTRVPGIETDQLVHYKESNHIAVYSRGRYFKLYVQLKGKILRQCDIQCLLQKILDDPSTPAEGEEHLAALTAGERVTWAKARKEFFDKGKNKASLDAVEKAAFVLVLDDEPQDYDPTDYKKLDNFGAAMLHGNGHNRWFDKSFTLVVCSNGRVGFNGEHAWADAPIMAHMWEYAVCDDIKFGADAPIMAHLWECAMSDDFNEGYKDDGNCLGEVTPNLQPPIRLEWELPRPCLQVIEGSLTVARQLIRDVDLHLLKHDAYGKGFMKKCKTSPDAYIQMALQLAYYRDCGKFCLTYESCMTRLYKEGRTETVRSCTVQSCDFVRSMEDTTKTNKERIEFLRKAAETHVQGYRHAMLGDGIDRHLFCLYVVSKYLGVDSPFLAEVLGEPWRLSTSQTPHQQTDKLDLVKHPEYISGGGGFGPVADDGYGVSYVIAGEDVVFFHISSKRPCPQTDSFRFGKVITRALMDIKSLFNAQ